MINRARVIAVEGFNGKYAIVEAERKSACEGCHKSADGECSVCTLLGGNRKISAKAKNGVGAKVGDTVEIESSSARILSYSALVFIFPVLAAVAGWFIGSGCGLNEGYSALCALGGFVAALAVAGFVSKYIAAKRCDVNIVKIII